MEFLNILKEEQNPLFPRREVEVEVSNLVAPKNEDVRKFLAEKFSVPEEAVKIHGIYGGFGHQKFKIIANIYQSKEDLEKIEFKSKKEKETEKKAEEARKKAEEDVKKEAAEKKKASESEQDEPKGDEKGEESQPDKEPESSEKQNEELSKPDEEPK